MANRRVLCDAQRVRSAVVLVASVALLVSRVDDAHACSCQPIAFDLPATDSNGAPTNLREIYLPTYVPSIGLHLRAADGEEVAVGVPRDLPGYHYTLWAVPVSAELRPNTHYTLWQDQVGSTQMRLTSFTTGSAPDHTAPPPPRFESLDIDYVGGDRGDSASCGRALARIDGHVAAPRDADIASVVMRFVRRNGESEERILPPSSTETLNPDETTWFAGVLGTASCQIYLDLLEDETYVVEAWTVDVAGNPSDVTTQEVLVDGGCAASRPSSLGGALAVLMLVLRRRQRPFRRADSLS